MTALLGAFEGPFAGLLNEVEGRLYALYINPSDDEAGILKGSFSGPVPGPGSWEATGTVYPVTSTTDLKGITGRPSQHYRGGRHNPGCDLGLFFGYRGC